MERRVETIRPARAEDLAAISRLYALHTTRTPETVGLQTDIDSETRCLLVAVGGDDVVGYGRARPFSPGSDAPANSAPAGYYLTGMVVDPAWRRRGTGEQLTRARMTWASDLTDRIWYFTKSTNITSLHLHARLGFREVTRDFVYPGVTFTGGEGVLSCAELRGAP
jgi:ribosomal protein S18 acetylase RimI-like enzyme